MAEEVNQLTGQRQMLVFSRSFFNDGGYAPYGDMLNIYLEKNFNIIDAEIVIEVNESLSGVQLIKNPTVYFQNFFGIGTRVVSGGSDLSSIFGGPWSVGAGQFLITRSREIRKYITPGQTNLFYLKSSDPYNDRVNLTIFVDGFFERLT